MTARAVVRTAVSGAIARTASGRRTVTAPAFEPGPGAGRGAAVRRSRRRPGGARHRRAAPITHGARRLPCRLRTFATAWFPLRHHPEKGCGQGKAGVLSGTARQTTRDPIGAGGDGRDLTGRVDDERTTKRNITILAWPPMAVAFLKQDGVRWNYASAMILLRIKNATFIYRNTIMNRNHKSGTNAAG